MFWTRFDKQNKDKQQLDEIEFCINLYIDHSLTASDLHNINISFALEGQIQKQELKDSRWRFGKTKSMTKYLYKIDGLNGSSYDIIPLRSNSILSIENNDKYCFISSIISYFQPCENTPPTTVKNYRQYFNELNNEGFDFNNGYKCIDVHIFEKLNNLSINNWIEFLSR